MVSFGSLENFQTWLEIRSVFRELVRSRSELLKNDQLTDSLTPLQQRMPNHKELSWKVFFCAPGISKPVFLLDISYFSPPKRSVKLFLVKMRFME